MGQQDALPWDCGGHQGYDVVKLWLFGTDFGFTKLSHLSANIVKFEIQKLTTIRRQSEIQETKDWSTSPQPHREIWGKSL